jgi:multiple sugar transport system permease protein
MSEGAIPSPAAAKRARGASISAGEARLAYMMLAPTVLIVLLIVILPVLWTIWMSMREVRLIDLQRANLWSFEFTAENYLTVLRGRNFLPIFQTTLIYTIGGSVLAIVGGLAAALLVNEKFPGRNVFRGFLLFPYIAPVVAVAFTWRMMLNAQFGIVNQLLDQPIDFFAQRFITLSLFGLELRWPLALSMVILFEGWRYFPFAFLFFLARLQALPEELYEAAAVDGAVPSQRFWYITLPQLSGVFATLFLLRFIWTFNKFDDIYLLTGGGAGTEIITVQIYEYLTGRSNIGAASALAVVLALFLIILVPLYVRFVAREEA